MIRENVKELKRTLRVSRKGQLQKFVHEIYIRKDISCGWGDCELCLNPSQSFEFNESKQLFIPDYDFLNSYFDILLGSQVKNVIVTQTIADLMKKDAKNQFKKLKSAVELEKWRSYYVLPNEFFEETILENSHLISKEQLKCSHLEKVIRFYSSHYNKEEIQLVVITENPLLLKACESLQVQCFDVRGFIHRFARQSEQLLDFLGVDLQQISAQIEQSSFKCTHLSYFDEASVIQKISTGEAFRGKIKFDRFDNKKAMINSRVLNRDILIEGEENINRAIQGDIVCVELLNRDQWKGLEQVVLITEEVIEDELNREEEEMKVKMDFGFTKYLSENPNVILTGRVRGIINRDLRDFCGELSSQKDGFGLISLMDGRLPNVLIAPRNLEALKGKKVLISIDSWPEHSSLPVGHLIKVFGDSDQVDVENQVILFEFNVETRQFSQKVLDCLPSEGFNWQIPQDEIDRRVDLREFFVCSVDPPGCRDIDDALHARILSNGNYEIGVHIADVSYFVRPDTPLDIEAS